MIQIKIADNRLKKSEKEIFLLLHIWRFNKKMPGLNPAVWLMELNLFNLNLDRSGCFPMYGFYLATHRVLRP